MMSLVVLLTSLVLAEGLNHFCSRNGEIEVTMRPPVQYEVELGQQVSIACAAHGHGMPDPYVYWVKGVGPGYKEKGVHLGPVAIGKSVLFYEVATLEEIDNYQCVIEDCCSNKQIIINIDVKVPDDTCEDVYGVGHVVYGATWVFTNWTQAVAMCEAKGMEIAFPETPEENDQLWNDIKASFGTHPNAKKYAHENWVWIGANDAQEEGTWVIQTKNEPVTWKNFQKGQPDNWTMNGKYAEGQDAVGMRRLTGEWDDSFIHHQRPYVCLCPKDPKE